MAGKLNRRDYLLLVAAGIGTAAGIGELTEPKEPAGVALPVGGTNVGGGGGGGGADSNNPVPSGETVDIGCSETVTIDGPWNIDGTADICGTVRVT